MKIKTIPILAIVLLIAGCASDSKTDSLRSRGSECALMCKENPEVKEYSQKHGGGITLLFIGGEEQKCTCNR